MSLPNWGVPLGMSQIATEVYGSVGIDRGLRVMHTPAGLKAIPSKISNFYGYPPSATDLKITVNCRTAYGTNIPSTEHYLAGYIRAMAPGTDIVQTYYEMTGYPSQIEFDLIIPDSATEIEANLVVVFAGNLSGVHTTWWDLNSASKTNTGTRINNNGAPLMADQTVYYIFESLEAGGPKPTIGDGGGGGADADPTIEESHPDMWEWGDYEGSDG